MSKKQFKVKLVVTLVAAICALTVAVSPAQANSISINFTSAAPDGLGNFLYTYTLQTGPDTFTTATPGVVSGPAGTFFTLYDFAGYVASSASIAGLNAPLNNPASWSITTQATGKTPGGSVPQITDGSTTNISFTYIGTPISLTAGQQGTFTLKSAFSAGQGGNIAWTGQDTSTGDQNTDDSGGTVTGPVPEPTSLLLLGTGMVGLVGVLRRRNRI